MQRELVEFVLRFGNKSWKPHFRSSVFFRSPPVSWRSGQVPGRGCGVRCKLTHPNIFIVRKHANSSPGEGPRQPRRAWRESGERKEGDCVCVCVFQQTCGKTSLGEAPRQRRRRGDEYRFLIVTGQNLAQWLRRWLGKPMGSNPICVIVALRAGPLSFAPTHVFRNTHLLSKEYFYFDIPPKLTVTVANVTQFTSGAYATMQSFLLVPRGHVTYTCANKSMNKQHIKC